MIEILNNQKVVYFICFLLAIYISFIQNRLTEKQMKFFNNNYIRILYLFIIILVFSQNNIIGILLVITYLTMYSSLLSEDFYVKENFYDYTPEQISKILKYPYDICRDGRHPNFCSQINNNYKIIEKSTKNILNTCNQKIEKKPIKKINFINQQNKYELFDINKKDKNDFNKYLNI